MSTSTSPSFWSRFRLSKEDESQCTSAVKDWYHGYQVQEFEEQGYCSFTFVVTPRHDIRTSCNDVQAFETTLEPDERREEPLILQIRPAQHALDISIANAAKEIYPSLAPALRYLDLELPGQLCAYEMQRMRGTPLSRLLPRVQKIDLALQENQQRLVESFAKVVAQSWLSALTSQPKFRTTRADSPMEDALRWNSQCPGKVGSSIISRLRKLSDVLPGARLRWSAETTLARVQVMVNYPVVLNHGDLIPTNILVDEDTWEITGLVDWAEAEYLPFGTFLYGLENLLGYVSYPSSCLPFSHEECSRTGNAPAFVYYENAPYLRELFWTRLFEAVPELKMRRDDVRTMRDAGVLLWYGYAWDDGAIDRVVKEIEDAVEVACLRAFLCVT